MKKKNRNVDIDNVFSFLSLSLDVAFEDVAFQEISHVFISGISDKLLEMPFIWEKKWKV